MTNLKYMFAFHAASFALIQPSGGWRHNATCQWGGEAGLTRTGCNTCRKSSKVFWFPAPELSWDAKEGKYISVSNALKASTADPATILWASSVSTFFSVTALKPVRAIKHRRPSGTPPPPSELARLKIGPDVFVCRIKHKFKARSASKEAALSSLPRLLLVGQLYCLHLFVSEHCRSMQRDYMLPCRTCGDQIASK